MALAPLALGTGASPIVTPSPTDKTNLFGCGPFSLALLNGLIKLLADRVDAIEASDNSATSASYNPATNILTLSMLEGPPVNIDMTTLIADTIATGIITGSSYNADTNVITLTMAHGATVPLDLSSVINDAVTTGLLSPSALLTLLLGVDGTGSGLDADLLDGQHGAFYVPVSQALGIGQTWQDVTGARASGVPYTNATSKPIFVFINCADTGATASVGVIVDGVSIVPSGIYDSSGSYSAMTVSFIVPAGGTYTVSWTAAAITWSELR